MVTAGLLVFILPKVMRPHPEWPEGDQIREDGSCPQSIVSIAGLRSTHELGSAASAALFLMGRLNRDGRNGPNGWSADTHRHHLGGGGWSNTLTPLSHIDKYRRPMRLGQECIDFVSLPIECQRVCASFRRHHLLTAHCANIDNVN